MRVQQNKKFENVFSKIMGLFFQTLQRQYYLSVEELIMKIMKIKQFGIATRFGNYMWNILKLHSEIKRAERFNFFKLMGYHPKIWAEMNCQKQSNTNTQNILLATVSWD